MQKYIVRNGIKTKEVTREWQAAEHQFQKEIVKVSKLCFYEWGEKVGTMIEVPTREYAKLREKWGKILNEQA